MSCQDPVHAPILFNGGIGETAYQRDPLYMQWITDADGSRHPGGRVLRDLESANFPYQWGVWTTAHARAALQ